MNNFTSMFVAILEKIELISHEEAVKLVKELHTATIPDTYEGALKIVDELFKKHEIGALASRVKPMLSNTETVIKKELTL